MGEFNKSGLVNDQNRKDFRYLVHNLFPKRFFFQNYGYVEQEKLRATKFKWPTIIN